jgi:hypothetical protein
MRTRLVLFALFVLAAGMFSAIHAQTAGVKPSVVTGDVVSIEDGKIVLQTKDGNLDVILSDKTQYKRVPPENPVLSAAVASELSEIGTGDKLVVTGIMPDDKKSLPARAVYLMTKSDIAQKQTSDSQRWTARGISGRVTSIDQLTKAIKVEVRGLMNTTTITLTPKDDAVYKRYAPNSVKYSEATSSNLLEIQPGDMLRAVGDRGADGTTFAAEEILTGAFQTVAGTVKSVDPAKNEVVITDLQTQKDVTIELGSASVLKKFPEEFANRMAQAGGGPGGMRPGAPGGRPEGAGRARPEGGQQRPEGARRSGGRGMGGQRGGIDEMLERFPSITAADLKAGDMIAVSSSKNHTPDRITAIKVLAGVEPFVKAAQMQAAASGGNRQVTQSLNIPGLDGIDIQ